MYFSSYRSLVFCFFNDTATTEIYTDCHTLSLHDALPISAADVTISSDTAFTHEAAYLQDELTKVLTHKPQLVDDASDATVVLRHQEAIHPEGYQLTVGTSGVVIEAATPAGAFYGIQSLNGQLGRASCRARVCK